MRLRHLRYFLAVAEEQSFTRAAAKVHIEPSPLSRAIKELEIALDARLLYRTRGRVKLTCAGEVFLEEARRMLALMDDARLRVTSAAKGFRGQLRIGLTDSLAQPQLTQLLALCREEDPLIEIRITEMTVTQMVKALYHDQIDAGFTVHTKLSNGLQQHAVWSDRPVIALPRNHPLLSFHKIPIREALRYPLILVHPDLCSGGYDVASYHLADPTLPPANVATYVSGHEPMMMLVAAGYGIGPGLESQLSLFRHPNVIVRPVSDDVPSTATYIAIPDKPPSEALSRFIARARQVGITTPGHESH